jgi:hypothetical protein
MNSPQQLADRVAGTAACANTRGTLASVEQALQWGVRAAQDGHPLALPILLDAAVFLNGNRWRGRRRNTPRRMAGTDARTRSYDRWIERLSRKAREYVGTRAEDVSVFQSYLSEAERADLATPSKANEPDYLPFLMSAAPFAKGDVSTEVWRKAYALLLKSADHKHRILTAWQSYRCFDRNLWSWWEDVLLTNPPHDDASPAGLWSLFATETGAAWLQENVDHVASEVYLRAAATKVTDSQSVRIQRLLKRRREYVSHPLTTSYDELDPYHGAVTLAMLCMGEYGLFKIANRSAIWISDPPSTQPPHPVRIHLCWTHAYPGLYHTALFTLPLVLDGGNVAPQGEGVEQAIEGTGASILQGVVALLIDDWQSALQKLPVFFHLHRGTTADNGLPLGKGRDRWRDANRHSYLPPAHAVAYLFRRPSHVDLADQALWRMPPMAEDTLVDWWCGCALSSDLGDFGFKLKKDPASHDGPMYWTGPTDRLPSCLSHIIVLDPQRRTRWSICRVRRSNCHELWPTVGCTRPEGEDYPYHELRRCALDTALSALEARL